MRRAGEHDKVDDAPRPFRGAYLSKKLTPRLGVPNLVSRADPSEPRVCDSSQKPQNPALLTGLVPSGEKLLEFFTGNWACDYQGPNHLHLRARGRDWPPTKLTKINSSAARFLWTI
jgi:hypothetical protein